MILHIGELKRISAHLEAAFLIRVGPVRSFPLPALQCNKLPTHMPRFYARAGRFDATQIVELYDHAPTHIPTVFVIRCIAPLPQSAFGRRGSQAVRRGIGITNGLINQSLYGQPQDNVIK